MFSEVILEASRRRYEREVRYSRFANARRQELIELAAEQDREEMQLVQKRSRRVNWRDWLPYIQESMGKRISQAGMAEHISEAVGFYVEPHRISNAIQNYNLEGRQRRYR